ncbi:sugar phosphate isomerase/epimerase family protein [Bacillus alkalicellulosilyticus]|uniref:sugar phosphate isomerase/epimerase family protein n=1 Tax=Alkalihalobacterium alkalicellulosilyticum TaxID=1912214 RepID=UPI0009969F9B|nr:sugar phosphate isomerase/epimerase [Bacillus alkalicellulosilyticus]
MITKPISIQLYTLREETSKDFVGTLKKVAELGYDAVEFAGFWGDLSAFELKAILDDLHLTVSGSHVSLEMLDDNIDGVIDYQKAIGSPHIILPNLPEELKDPSNYEELTKKLNAFGEKCTAAGVTFSYHNHAFELESHEGRKGLDILLEDSDPELVKAELDVYWLRKAGENPVDWLKKYEGRTPLIHLKDMTTDGEQFFAELGTGGIDLASIIQFGEQSGVEYWVVEQDQTRKTALESAQISINYLKENFTK